MQTTMMRMRTSREITHSGDGSIMHDEEGKSILQADNVLCLYNTI